MDNIAYDQILILFSQCLIVALLLIFLFRLRTIFGLGLLFTALGVFQYLQVFLSSSLLIELAPGIIVSPGTVVFFSGSLFAILLVYIREDALEARKVIYALVIANLVLSLIHVILSWGIDGEGVKNIYNLPKTFYTQQVRIVFIGSLVLYFDTFMLIFLYEVISRYVSILFLRILFTMVIVISIDSLLFSLGIFGGTNHFLSSLVSGLISKIAAVFVYSILVVIYLKYIDNDSVKSEKKTNSFKDIFYSLTYRQKFEQVYVEKISQEKELHRSEEYNRLLFNTSPIGMALCRMNGSFVDINPAYAKILGRTIEETLKLTYWDITDKKYASQEAARLRNLEETGSYVSYEKEYIHAKGHFVPVVLNGLLIERDGEKYIWSSVENIGERKKAENALRNSELNLKKSQEIAKLGSWVLDFTNQITWSDEMYRIYGVSPETFTPDTETFINIIHPDDRKALKEWINACKQNEKPEELVFRITHSDETVRVVSGRGELISDKEGKPIYISGTVQDITERKNAEKIEKKYNRRIKGILESINDAFVSLDTNWNYTYVNKKAGEIFNQKPEEMIGKHIWKEFPDMVNLPFYHKCYLAVETQEPQFLEEYYPAYDCWYGNYIYPSIEGLSIFFHDITEQKNTEEEITTTNKELKTINRIILAIDKTSNLNELLEKILEEALQMVGLEGGTVCLIEPDATLNLIVQRDLFKKKTFDLSDKRIKVGSHFCDSCAKGFCPLVLFDQKTKHKYSVAQIPSTKEINFHTSYSFNSKETCLGILRIFTRTNKKPTERSLKLLETLTKQFTLAIENALLLNQLEYRVSERTMQLESSNKELESFSYSISHDLRAPLRAIYGFSQILTSRHHASLNEEGKQYMNYIVEASVRMEQLINDLLEYSRLGRSSFEMRSVSLKTIVGSIYSDFMGQLEEVGGEFMIIDELPQLLGDETILRQAFTNLIDNAIKYRRSDTPLIIAISNEPIEDGYLIKLTDNGIGIPREHWDKIFDVFQRLHSEEKYPGTGIGLATFKKAVHMLGGTTYVESTVGKGSTFYIKFPKHKI